MDVELECLEETGSVELGKPLLIENELNDCSEEALIINSSEREKDMMITTRKYEEKESEENDPSLEEEDDGAPYTKRKELKQMWKIAWPTAIGELARIAMRTTDTAFLGHLGTKELSGVTMACVWMSVSSPWVFAPGWALNGICSQAIGAKNPKLAGIWLQLALALGTITCILGMIAFSFTGTIVGWVSDDDEIIHHASRFGRLMIFKLPCEALWRTTCNYFSAKEIVMPATIVSICAVFVNIAANWILIHGIGDWEGLGFDGSPLATTITVAFQCFSFLLYTIWYKGYHKDMWPGWTLESFKISRIKEYSKIAMPSLLTAVFEESGFQTVELNAGHLVAIDLAALSITWNTWGILFAFYWGFGLAIQVRVGKHLGANKPSRAIIATKMGIMLVLGVVGTVCALIYAIHNELPKLFTNDEEVISIAAGALLLLPADFFWSCVTIAAANSLDGMSRPTPAGIIAAIASWGIFVPGGLWAIFHKRDENPVTWVWVFAALSALFSSIFTWIVVCRTNWDEQARKAQERCEKNKPEGEEKEVAETKKSKKLIKDSSSSNLVELGKLLMEDEDSKDEEHYEQSTILLKQKQKLVVSTAAPTA